MQSIGSYLLDWNSSPARLLKQDYFFYLSTSCCWWKCTFRLFAYMSPSFVKYLKFTKSRTSGIQSKVAYIGDLFSKKYVSLLVSLASPLYSPYCLSFICLKISPRSRDPSLFFVRNIPRCPSRSVVWFSPALSLPVFGARYVFTLFPKRTHVWITTQLCPHLCACICV